VHANFLDQVERSLLLKEMPMLDNIDITVRQTGDQSRGMHIPGTDAAGSRRSADATSGPGKRKEKVVPSGSASKGKSWSPSRDVEVSSEEIVPM
jgi:hypothetical protein